MKSTYTTFGTCSRFIDIDLEGGYIEQVKFIGGCSGSAQGIAALVRGMEVSEAIARLRGIQCRAGTSCPDQLAQALEGLQHPEEAL